MTSKITIFGVDYGTEDKSIVTVLDKNEVYTYEYRTIDGWFRRNGHRHLERAIAYASAGYPDRFYEGSMRKAIKNFKKADDFKLPDWMIKAVDRFVVDVSDNILNGNTNVSNDRTSS